ncbi:hypothetical protein BjapCC829_48785 (plasmid) [Bradyrhizobium barranii]|uniref:Uncharacterized protein n=1 Tax=Bradyrhizobium barranii TaxID=2992140 RepID=A0ABY3R2U1_9BRAD|nr:hypothetical protein [Bradyrhizobium japonicum]UFW92139.1 hypothetical protein BjapCC829_48785 [Bradyrhizobium japonicum]
MGFGKEGRSRKVGRRGHGCELRLALVQLHGSQVVAIERNDVEGVELGVVVVTAGVQPVELRNAAHIEHADLTIDHELLGADLPGRLDDHRVAVGQIEASPRSVLDGNAVTDHATAIAVVLDLVDPVRSVRNDRLGRRLAELKRLGYAR